eukprot:3935663-Rhodomonas_salina.1
MFIGESERKSTTTRSGIPLSNIALGSRAEHPLLVRVDRRVSGADHVGQLDRARRAAPPTVGDWLCPHRGAVARLWEELLRQGRGVLRKPVLERGR